jgi:hypothetical protein
VKEREAWTSGAQSVPYIALAADRQRKASSSGNASNAGKQTRAALYGAGLTLLEGNRHGHLGADRLEGGAGGNGGCPV